MSRVEVRGDFVVKSVDEASRQIKGYFSTPDPDREQDVILPGWFATSIAPGGNYYNNPVLLYNHDADRLVGKALVDSLNVDEVGVYGEFEVSEDEAWAQIARKELRGFSWFGLVDFANGDVDLVEVTVTPTPMNPKALFEMKSKALKAGLASPEDFPSDDEETMPGKKSERQKAVYLGPYAESEMASAAMRDLTYGLFWRVESIMEAFDTPSTDRLQSLQDLMDEYCSLCMKVAGALITEATPAVTTAAVKALRETFPRPPRLAGETTEDEVEVDEDKVKQLIAESMAPVTKALEQLTQRLTVAPAATPAAPPAAPVAPAPSPESTGDASVATKQVGAGGQVTLDAQGISTLVEEMFKRMPGNPQGVTPGSASDPNMAGKKKHLNAQTALAERVKTAKYDGPGAENKWNEHTLDAVAIELTGRRFDDVEDDSTGE